MESFTNFFQKQVDMKCNRIIDRDDFYCDKFDDLCFKTSCAAAQKCDWVLFEMYALFYD